MDGWLVSELHFELGRLRSQPGDNISGVVHISDYDGSSRITDVENVGDGLGGDSLTVGFHRRGLPARTWPAGLVVAQEVA